MKENSFQTDPLLVATKFILDFYYGDISLETINSFTPKGENGFDEHCVITVANSLGLHGIDKSINAEDIPEYFLPCIIFDKLNHPLVYIKKIGNEIAVFDPFENHEKKIEKSKLKEFKKAIIVFRESNKKEYAEQEKTKSWFFDP